jgi:PAS domain S-box-containing protein
MNQAVVTEARLSGAASPAGDRLDFLSPIFDLPRRKVLLIVACLVAGIATTDAFLEPNLSIGLLYTFPILLASLSLKRWEMAILVLVCAVLREQFSPYAWEQHAATRFLSTAFSYGAVGLLLNEIARNRKLVIQHYLEVQEQVDRRVEAESQLRTIIESSPAAILTLDESGIVDLANRQAHVLFGVLEGSLVGTSIRDYLPLLADIVDTDDASLPYRTAASCRAKRVDGESFLASIWFGTYQTRSGRRLAAIIADASEDLRDWQETSFQSLLRSTRVLVGSVSHEIRNVCAAISVVHANLGRIPAVARSEDYAALGTLAAGLSRLATAEMSQAAEPGLQQVQVEDLIEELKIVIEPTLRAEEIRLTIGLDSDLPPVSADRHGLLQVFLNLTRNSVRALQQVSQREIKIEGSLENGAVCVCFADSGTGIAHPERLFKPFQEGADAVGLGLFVSRAIVRACGGELYHKPSPRGCTIVVRLQPCEFDETPGHLNSSEVAA